MYIKAKTCWFKVATNETLKESKPVRILDILKTKKQTQRLGIMRVTPSRDGNLQEAGRAQAPGNGLESLYT